MNPHKDAPMPINNAFIENTATPVTVMTRLRDETAIEHRAVEKAFNLKSATESLGGYRDLLMCLYGIHAPFEAVLRQSEVPVPMDGRWKSEFLYQDLRHLKVSAASIEKTWRKATPQLPPMKSIAQMIGSLYVLEGSTLGGQFIYKALQRKLPVNAEKGARFFAGYGADTHAKWAEFGRAACAIIQSNKAQQDRVIDAAKDMFVFVGKRLAKR